jgi:ClpP class serine protease
MDLGFLIWLFFIAQLFIPLTQKQVLQARRRAAIRGWENRRGTRAITMIHRQETMNILGFPVARYIDIEDSEQVLRAIRLTPPDMPIDLLLHTPGGVVLAAEQIAYALRRHRGKVTVFVPHYAMSGGTLIALAAGSIVMDPNAVLGPVDPQLGLGQGAVPASSVLEALKEPNPNRDDQTLILGDVGRKALKQVKESVKRLLVDRLGEAEADAVATRLSSGEWTHDHPLDVELLRKLRLPVSEDMPTAIYELMDLYPQTNQQRPGVEYIPLPYTPRQAPATSTRDKR